MFSNWKIKDLIILGFSIPTILVLGFSLIVYFTANQSTETFKKVNRSQTIIDEKQLMTQAILNMDRRIRRYFIDTKINEDALELYTNDRKMFQENFTLLSKTVQDSAQRSRMDEMYKLYQNYNIYVQKSIKKNEIKNQKNLVLFFNNGKEYIEDFLKISKAFDKREKDILDDSIFLTNQSLNIMNLSALVASMVCLILAIIASVFIAQFLEVRINKAVQAAEQISVGDLTNSVVDTESNSNNEIGKLLKSFQIMTQNLNILIRQVQQSGIGVTTSATQIAASGKQLEATMTEQVASTNEVAATAKEISATSRELVKTMEEVALMSQTTTIATSSSQKDLLRMELTMRQLGEATNTIATRLGTIGEKANNINNIVVMITKVADQTNLLSLNAAIEAEKAGEYGLGFAVVAREIRRLADQTAVATLEIEKMVKQMQSSVSSGVMEMDKFAKEVEQSVEDVASISKQMAQIIEQVQELTPRFEAVNSGMEAQSQGAQQISDAMIQLSNTSTQTTDSLREINNAIHQLNQVAQGLRHEMSRFKVTA
ncbi:MULTISPECIES: methyl-accepting chemotaxis protein [Nostocales]